MLFMVSFGFGGFILCEHTGISLYALTAEGMSSVHAETSDRLTRQSGRVTTYQAPNHEIPGEHRCAGDCTHPVPPPPEGTGRREAFVSFVSRNEIPWFHLGSAAIIIGTVALVLSRQKR